MKLSDKLINYRTGRPDEWTMDEFIRDAIQLEESIKFILSELVGHATEVPIKKHNDEEETLDSIDEGMDLTSRHPNYNSDTSSVSWDDIVLKGTLDRQFKLK